MLRLLSGSGVLAAFTLSRSWAKLLRLSESGDSAGLKALLQRSPKLQAPGSLETLWHEAARRGSNEATLTCLWRAGQHCEELRGTVDALNQHGESPLMAALKKGHGKTALWFLAQGAQALRWDGLRRCSTVHLAARGGSEEACAALLDRLPESQRSLWANARSETCRVRPIHYAAAFGHAKVVRLLLQQGANYTAVFRRCPPESTGADYHAQLEARMEGETATALHMAAVNNSMAVAAELLDHYMSHADTLVDPRLVTVNSPSLLELGWRHNASQLVWSNPRLFALLRPGGDLSALLAHHLRGHFVPTLAALAATAMRHGLVAGIDAVEGEARRTPLPQVGRGGVGRGAGGRAGGPTRQTSLPAMGMTGRRTGGGVVRRASLPAAPAWVCSAGGSGEGGGGGGNEGSVADSGCLALRSTATSSSQLPAADAAAAAADLAAAAGSGIVPGGPCTSRRISLRRDASSSPLQAVRLSAASASSLALSASCAATVWQHTADGGSKAAAAAVASSKASAAAVFSAVCVAQALGADDAAMRLAGDGGDDDAEGSATDEELRCSVCLCNEVELQVQGCRHRLCCDCMRAMAVRGGNVPLLCPMCRGPVKAVEPL